MPLVDLASLAQLAVPTVADVALDVEQYTVFLPAFGPQRF